MNAKAEQQNEAHLARDYPAERTAVITGAASPRGIGRATAHRLAAGGWNIGVLDRDPIGVEELTVELRSRYGVDSVGVIADVTDQRSAQSAVAQLADALPPIFALANIAGVSSPTPYFDLDLDEWRRIMAVNLDGVHHVTQPIAKMMRDSGRGRIVMVSSVSAQRGGGTFGKTPYSASKAAVVGFARSLARELGPYSVTVNAIAPGPIDTDIMGGPLDEERRAGFISQQMIPRVGTVDDVAGAVEFLVGPAAGFITGQTLSVNGGLHLGS